MVLLAQNMYYGEIDLAKNTPLKQIPSQLAQTARLGPSKLVDVLAHCCVVCSHKDPVILKFEFESSERVENCQHLQMIDVELPLLEVPRPLNSKFSHMPSPG